MIDQTFLDALPVPVVVLDREGRVVCGNDPAERPGNVWTELPAQQEAFSRLWLDGGHVDLRTARGRWKLHRCADRAMVVLEPRSALQKLVHSLRQPLTNLMGYTALMDHPSASPEQRSEAVAVVQRAAQEMSDLLAAASREEP